MVCARLRFAVVVHEPPLVGRLSLSHTARQNLGIGTPAIEKGIANRESPQRREAEADDETANAKKTP
jgi:hypothetical protein